MAKCEKLLAQLKRSQKNVSFDDLIALAVCQGYVESRKSGSHVIMRHHTHRLPYPYSSLNFQNVKGQAKPYQVRQLLDAIEFIHMNP